jgi:AraC-like DNA-binding protein
MADWLKLDERTLNLIRGLLDGSTEPLNQYPPGIVKAMTYMAHHCQEEGIRLQDVAAQSNVSGSHLCWLFKHEVGLSVRQFLAVLRVERAKQVLSDRYARVQDAADACGFGDLSSFERTFKKWVGCTPREYRKKALAQTKGAWSRDG